MTTTTKISSTTRIFIAFILQYFGIKWIRQMNARTDESHLYYVCSEVERIARSGMYAEVPGSYANPSYALAWAIQTGRVNGLTHMAIRQMDCRAILKIIAQLAEQNIAHGDTARYLMSLDLQPAR